MLINFSIFKSKKIAGVMIFEPTISKDDRGNIWTSYMKKDIEQFLPENLSFIHDKFSQSKKNVLRGIHGDQKSWKLVTCVHGCVQQVVVDCRKESPSYGVYESFQISERNQIMVLIPSKLGNAYLVESSSATYHYKLAYEGDYIDAKDQFSIKWNDPRFNIKWSIKKPILSKRDE